MTRSAVVARLHLVRYVFSSEIFGDLENFIFLETVAPTESEK